MEHKDLLAHLRAAGQLEYGSVVMGGHIRALLGLEYPEVGTKKQFDALALTELSAINYIRDRLLSEGKYLVGIRGDYRVLLPSENASQAEALMDSADRKMRRARKLLSNTPPSDTDTATAALLTRVAMRENATRRGLPQ
mgnify:FL=1